MGLKMNDYKANSAQLGDALQRNQRNQEADMKLWQTEGVASQQREKMRRIKEDGNRQSMIRKGARGIDKMLSPAVTMGSATSMPGMSAVGTYDALVGTSPEFSMGTGATAVGDGYTAAEGAGMAGEGAGAGEGAVAGGEAAGAAEGGTAGSGGYATGVGAAILGQHMLSQGTDTTFEGQKTGDAFNGHLGTEPWLGYVASKVGASPTAGERWDASMNNKEYGQALRRTPAMADYWANPGGGWLTTAGEGVGMSRDASQLAFNPLGFFLGKI